MVELVIEVDRGVDELGERHQQQRGVDHVAAVAAPVTDQPVRPSRVMLITTGTLPAPPESFLTREGRFSL